MVDRINELIDESGGDIATAGWLPGSDWTDTPFAPIYTKAARGNFDLSAIFFGQLVEDPAMNGRRNVDCRVVQPPELEITDPWHAGNLIREKFLAAIEARP